MDPVILGLIITGVLGIASGAGLWGYLSTRAERPLKAREVENATLGAVQAGYAGLLKDLREDLDRVGDEVDKQGIQIKELRSEIRAQNAVIDGLRAALRAAMTWIDDIHIRWEWYRAQKDPPPKPYLQYALERAEDCDNDGRP